MLYHPKILKTLTDKQLQSLHGRCGSYRTKKRLPERLAYVSRYSIEYLEQYHLRVLKELRVRDINTDPQWWISYNRKYKSFEEHDDSYLYHCASKQLEYLRPLIRDPLNKYRLSWLETSMDYLHQILKSCD